MVANRSLLLLAMLGTALHADPARAEPSAPDPTLSADQIYERVLANRFDSSVQEVLLVSGDRSGREQRVEVQMLWRRYAEESSEARSGVGSRTLIRYLAPSDVRGTGYLVINKRNAPNDQFMYLNSMRRIRRVSLRGEAVIGTDLSVEDIVPREMDDATYVRVSDDEIGGQAVYVIEATPIESAQSQYGHIRLHIETEHFVPLRTQYWDRAGVETKEMRADVDSIREIDGVWVPLKGIMRHLLEGGFTTVQVQRLAPNAPLEKRYFTQRQLEAKKIHLPKKLMEEAHEFRWGG